MNKEIKEILDRLERIDHKENKTAFEFADSATFDEMARCFKERKMMADYITNLQEENKRLKELDENYPIEEQLEEALKYENIYKSRNKKAIEYIKSYKNDYAPYELSDYNIRKLLNILKGSDE